MPRITLVTPAKASANNGNWHTAARWQSFLSATYRVDIVNEWAEPDSAPGDAMIALHARRSATSIASFANSGRPLAVVLTGTDLYRDIATDDSAKRSLDLADHLVVLQAQGLEELAPQHRSKAIVIEQSAPQMVLPERSTDTIDCVMVGHMRSEKDPLTALRAFSHLPDSTLRLNHAGRTDDPQIGPQALSMASHDTRIVLHGPLDHQASRELIARSQIMLLPSVMEGGANVLIEAVMSGVPVLASRIGGSIGMLGPDYAGYFPVGDDNALAQLIARCISEPAFAEQLRVQCAARAPLFEPEREAANVQALASKLFS